MIYAAQQNADKVELHGNLEEFRQALEDEIEKIKKSGQSSTLLFGGRKLQNGGGEYRYRFNVEYMPSMPADTPCKLSIQNDYYDVTVISSDEDSIVISSKTQLPDTIAKAKLENGATILMERLIKRIEEKASTPNPAGERMLATADKTINIGYQKIRDNSELSSRNQNNESQNRAVVAALSYDITYIWGPPGTGKTTVIGQIISELLNQDRSVLIVSHTNTAVDGAIDKADDVYKDCAIEGKMYPILRLGKPVTTLSNRVLLESHVDELGRVLFNRKKELEDQRTGYTNRLQYVDRTISQHEWLECSSISLLQAKIDEIHTHEQQKLDAESIFESANLLLSNYTKEHPECKEYVLLNGSFLEKDEEKQRLEEEIASLKDCIQQLPEKIEEAEDELKKHNIYEELSAKESEMMSAAFFNTSISNASKTIGKLELEQKSLNNEKQKLEKTAFDYQKKNSVAKLFTSKATLLQTEKKLISISDRLPVLLTEMEIQTKLREDYQRQLKELLLLQEQKNALSPSETKVFWTALIGTLKMQLEMAQQELPLAESNYDKLDIELREISDKMAIAQKSHLEYENLSSNRQEAFERLQKLSGSINYEKNQCAKMLENEYKFCEGFYECKSSTMEGIYSELRLLFDETATSVQSININELKNEQRAIHDALSKIPKEIDELNEKIQELEKQVILQSKVIGTTLAKSYLSDILHERSFDTVVLDEASMASIPALWCAAYLAEKNIVIVGDFLQLPPIVMADTPMAKKWLGSDIFLQSGMQERIKKPNKCPDNFIMLNEQYRMEKEIADIANRYYGDYELLKSVDHGTKRDAERDEFYGWYAGKRTEHCVHLINTESLHAWVTGIPQGKKHSRLNCFSASICVDLAFELLSNKIDFIKATGILPQDKPSVLIIAPYKPHVAKLNQLIALEYKAHGLSDEVNLIQAGTIHSFQGSEAEIVIFDLVIDEPHYKANLFMPDLEINKDLEKMFNVAITRAKFKLFIIGNFPYCFKHAKNNALGMLLAYLKEQNFPMIDAKSAFPKTTYAPKKEYVSNEAATDQHIICREDSFYEYFIEEISCFKTQLIIYSPFITEGRLSVLLPYFEDAISEGKKIIVVTKSLSDRKNTEMASYQKCENVLREHGVIVLHKKGMHEKLVFVDDDTLWMGSLNVLSFTGLTGEIMCKHKDKKLSEEYKKIFDIGHICEVASKVEEQKCPICGGEMIIGESDTGGIYWACVNKDYARNVEQQYPSDGVLRCKCGAPYIFSMKNQPRWVCSENPAHYQLMRENDLKLEKMKVLIPTKKELNAVEQYFKSKHEERNKK